MTTSAYRLRHARELVVLCTVSAALVGAILATWSNQPPSLAGLTALGLAIVSGYAVLTGSAIFVSLLFTILTGSAVLTGVAWGVDQLNVVPAGWEHYVGAAVAVAALIAAAKVPVTRLYSKTDQQIVAAPRDHVWRTFLPTTGADYWKPNMTIAPVEGSADEFRITLGEGSADEGGTARFRLVDVVTELTFTILTVEDGDADTDIMGACTCAQVIDLEDAGNGATRIVSTFSVRAPSLYGIAVLVLFDPPGDELRRFKALTEGTADATFGATL